MLTEQEEHTLSIVDGTLDERELAVATGLDPEELAEQLERLAMMGVISLEGGGEADTGRASTLPGELPGDGIALAIEARKHIETMYALLEEADYYELLGVSRDADKGDIKAAYYRIGPGFHPDKHFGKEIGHFKGKVERIFSLLTKAHDTLRYNKRRQSYDATLPPPRAGAKQRREAVARAGAYFAGLSERRSRSKRTSEPDGAGTGSAGQPAARPGAPPMESYTAPRSGAPPGRRNSSGVTERAAQSPSSAAVSTTPPVPSNQAAVTQRPPTTRRPIITGRPAPSTGPPSDPAAPPPATSAPPPEPAPAAPQTAPPRRPPPPMTEEERRIQRDTLAKKLRSRGAPPAAVTRHHRPQPVQPKVTQRDPASIQAKETVDRSATEVLRDRYETIATAARKRRLDRYLDQGRVAMAAGDYRAASAAYSQAEKLSPDDVEIADLANRSANLARQMGD